MEESQYLDIFKATLKKWGEGAQYDQAIEECAEFIAALKHYKRGKVTEEAIIDELADVILMSRQIAYMLGEERIEQAIEKKIVKLRTLLETS